MITTDKPHSIGAQGQTLADRAEYLATLDEAKPIMNQATPMQRRLRWLWGLLPDRCQVRGCRRRGVRGNENIVDDRLVCDGCHADILAEGNRD